MKISTISKKLIKPQTPTPQHLKNYHLSFLDHPMSSMTIPVAMFYQSKPENATHSLQESLSEILVKFYPLAGRYTSNDPFIDCSDQGAVFIEAEALDVDLTIAKSMDINNFLPDLSFESDAANPLLSIQLTHFPCGGVAVAIIVSHVVFDGVSLGTFVDAWWNATNPNRKMEFAPSFDLPSLLPYKDHGYGGVIALEPEDLVVKRFSFDKEVITRLRSGLNPNREGRNPSRVRVVSVVIARALIRLDRAKQGKARDFAISQLINMRGRTTMPLPKHACGNFAILSLTRHVAASDDGEIGMQELVDLMGDGIKKSIDDHAEILSPDRDGRDIIISSAINYFSELINPERNILCFTDWTKFGFYEVDFGWGKPIGVSARSSAEYIEYTVLMSNREGDGIEAWVHLKQDDMDCFEQDEEIKSFAT